MIKHDFRWEEKYSVESNYEKWSNQSKQSNSDILKKGKVYCINSCNQQARIFLKICRLE